MSAHSRQVNSQALNALPSCPVVPHLALLGTSKLSTDTQSLTDISIAGPLHIPAKRPGFEPDPSVIRHPHAWGYETGFESQYHTHSQYYLERDRKSVYYGYPEAQFPQVRLWLEFLTDQRILIVWCFYSHLIGITEINRLT